MMKKTFKFLLFALFATFCFLAKPTETKAGNPPGLENPADPPSVDDVKQGFNGAGPGAGNETQEEGNGIGNVDRVIKDEKTFYAATFAIYAAILYFVGLFSSKLPFLGWIDDTKARIIALAILLGLGYFGIYFSFDIELKAVIVLAVGYLFSSNGIHPAFESKFNWKTIKTSAESEKKLLKQRKEALLMKGLQVTT